MSETGATPEQIEAAKDWTEDYLDVLTATGRAIAAEAVRRTVAPDSRIIGPEQIAALRRLLDWATDDAESYRLGDGQMTTDIDTLTALIGDDE